MEKKLPASEKAEFQRQFRSYQEHQRSADEYTNALAHAKENKIWMAGVFCLLFSMHSDFFLGGAFGFLTAYFANILSIYMKRSKAEENRQQLEYWFNGKGITVADRVFYFTLDEQREKPIQLLDEALYS